MFLRTVSKIAVLTVFLTFPAFAQTGTAPKALGTFGGWSAYTFTEGGQPVCYMALRTRGGVAKKIKRGPVLLTITQRPGENTKDVVSYNAGYNFKASSDIKIRIGKEDFDLFTQKDTAWSRDAMTDHALTSAIRKSGTMAVTGIPAAKGAAPIIDTLDLKGAAEAYRAIGKACGLEVKEPSKTVSAVKKKAPTKH